MLPRLAENVVEEKRMQLTIRATRTEKQRKPKDARDILVRGPSQRPGETRQRPRCGDIWRVWRLIRAGSTVLVYSPQRSQVETLANEFRHIADQGYLSSVKAPIAEQMALAMAIGHEWLGETHAAVQALEIGVGTHHGALPRPFLNAIEELLDARRLSIVVASPTLAQGIDLACSVLIFRSIRRYEDGKWRPISPAEFANVVGRAGRAYVDLDGIAVLPTFDAQSRSQQHEIFASLVEESRGQRLSSGLAQLIWQIGKKLADKLGVPKGELLEYVLNQHDLWADSRLAAQEESAERHNRFDSLQLFGGIGPNVDLRGGQITVPQPQ